MVNFGHKLSKMLLLSLLLILIVVQASYSISKEDQDKYLILTHHMASKNTEMLASRFERPETRTRVYLESVQEAWREVFGFQQTSVKCFSYSMMTLTRVPKILDALSRGLTYIPLRGEDGQITIYMSWALASSYECKVLAITTTMEGLLAFRSGDWIKRPFWRMSGMLLIRQHPEVFHKYLKQIVENTRKEQVLFHAMVTVFSQMKRMLNAPPPTLS